MGASPFIYVGCAGRHVRLQKKTPPAPAGRRETIRPRFPASNEKRSKAASGIHHPDRSLYAKPEAEHTATIKSLRYFMKGGFAANKNKIPPASEKLPSQPEVVGHDLRVVPQ
jgi:hypothetical protein